MEEVLQVYNNLYPKKPFPDHNDLTASLRAVNISACPHPLQNEGGLILTSDGTFSPKLTGNPRAFATIARIQFTIAWNSAVKPSVNLLYHYQEFLSMILQSTGAPSSRISISLHLDVISSITSLGKGYAEILRTGKSSTLSLIFSIR